MNLFWTSLAAIWTNSFFHYSLFWKNGQLMISCKVLLLQLNMHNYCFTPDRMDLLSFSKCLMHIFSVDLFLKSVRNFTCQNEIFLHLFPMTILQFVFNRVHLFIYIDLFWLIIIKGSKRVRLVMNLPINWTFLGRISTKKPETILVKNIWNHLFYGRVSLLLCNWVKWGNHVIHDNYYLGVDLFLNIIILISTKLLCISQMWLNSLEGSFCLKERRTNT